MSYLHELGLDARLISTDHGFDALKRSGAEFAALLHSEVSEYSLWLDARYWRMK